MKSRKLSRLVPANRIGTWPAEGLAFISRRRFKAATWTTYRRPPLRSCLSTAISLTSSATSLSLLLGGLRTYCAHRGSHVANRPGVAIAPDLQSLRPNSVSNYATMARVLSPGEVPMGPTLNEPNGGEWYQNLNRHLICRDCKEDPPNRKYPLFSFSAHLY